MINILKIGLEGSSIGFLLSSFLQLGQTDASFSFEKIILQGGAYGLLACVLLYVFKVLIPGILTLFEKTLTEQRKDFLEALKEHREELKRIMETLR